MLLYISEHHICKTNSIKLNAFCYVRCSNISLVHDKY